MIIGADFGSKPEAGRKYYCLVKPMAKCLNSVNLRWIQTLFIINVMLTAMSAGSKNLSRHHHVLIDGTITPS